MKNKILVGIMSFLLLFSIGCKKEEQTVETEEKKFVLEEEVEAEVEEQVEDENLNYVLYLKYEDQDYLYDEMFTVKKKDVDLESQPLETFLVQQLIDAIPVRDLVSPIPTGTKVLGTEKKDGIVTVNLSKEFNPNGLTQLDAGIALAAVVDTITLIEGNNQVKILIEGEEVKEYYGVQTDKPLYFIESYFPNK